MGILQRQTRAGFDAEALGGSQERIGSGFASLIVAITDDLVEPTEQVMGGEMTLHRAVGR
jgi:hypothetical protein